MMFHFGNLSLTPLPCPDGDNRQHPDKGPPQPNTQAWQTPKQTECKQVQDDENQPLHDITNIESQTQPLAKRDSIEGQSLLLTLFEFDKLLRSDGCFKRAQS